MKRSLTEVFTLEIYDTQGIRITVVCPADSTLRRHISREWELRTLRHTYKRFIMSFFDDFPQICCKPLGDLCPPSVGPCQARGAVKLILDFLLDPSDPYRPRLVCILWQHDISRTYVRGPPKPDCKTLVKLIHCPEKTLSCGLRLFLCFSRGVEMMIS